jgi:hypothetical protein
MIMGKEGRPEKAVGYPPASSIDTGYVENGTVKFPEWRGPSEASGGDPKPLVSPQERVGFAVVGLGRLSLGQILPAFAQCAKARLVALVSGSSDKLDAVATQYGVTAQPRFRSRVNRDAGTTTAQERFVNMKEIAMIDKVDPDAHSNLEKDPDDWVSRNEPMTGAQASYLKTLTEQAHEPDKFDDNLTKAEASKRIDELRSAVDLD